MALNGGRMVLYLLGTLLVIAGIWLFLSQSGLSRWIPAGMLVAGVLLIFGLAVMGFANNSPEEERHVHHDDDRDVTVIRR